MQSNCRDTWGWAWINLLKSLRQVPVPPEVGGKSRYLRHSFYAQEQSKLCIIHKSSGSVMFKSNEHLVRLERRRTFSVWEGSFVESGVSIVERWIVPQDVPPSGSTRCLQQPSAPQGVCYCAQVRVIQERITRGLSTKQEVVVHPIARLD